MDIQTRLRRFAVPRVPAGKRLPLWTILLLLAGLAASLALAPEVRASQFIDNLATDFYAGDLDNISIRQNVDGSLQLEPYGMLGGWATTTAPNNTSLHLSSAAVYNGKIYLTGGYGNTESYSFGAESANALNNIWYGTMFSDGSIDEFKEVDDTSVLPQPTYGHASVVVNGRLYIIGGRSTANAPLKSVYWGKIIGHDGSIKAYYQPNTWTAVASLPMSLFRCAAVQNEGVIYVIGGLDETDSAQSAVYCGAVQPDGNVISWQPAAASLPVGLAGHNAVYSNNRIYVIGGSTSGQVHDAVGDVYVGALDPLTRNVISWTQTESLPEPVFGASSAMAGGKIWVSGGITSGTARSSLYFARIDPTTGLIPAPGLRDTWSRGTDLPIPVYNHNLVAFNSHLYVIGGLNNSGIQNQVYTATLVRNKATITRWVPTTPLFLSKFGGNVYDIWTGHAAVLRAPIPGEDFTSAKVPYVYVIGGGPNTFSAYADGNGDASVPPPGAYSTVYNSEVATNGTLKVWEAPDTGGVIPIASIMHAATLNNGATPSIYIIGGANSLNAYVWAGAASRSVCAVAQLDGNSLPCQTARTNVWYEEYNQSGATSGGAGSFEETAPIPILDPIMTNTTMQTTYAFTPDPAQPIYQPLMRTVAVSHNGNVYVLGGITRQNDWAGSPTPHSAETSTPVYENRVWFCRPNPSGTINGGDVSGNSPSGSGTVGGWKTTTPLPVTLYDMSACVAYNRIYVFGGTSGGTAQSAVYMAPVNSDGTLGAWQVLEPMASFGVPVLLTEHQVVFMSGNFYIIGGRDQTGNLRGDIYYCTPNPSTGLIPAFNLPGCWTRSSTTLEYPVAGHKAVGHNGFIYIVGGRYNPADPHTSSSYMSSIVDMFHTQDIVYSPNGQYERYIDLGCDQPVEVLTWEGDPNSEILLCKTQVALEKGVWSPWTPYQAAGPILLNRFARYVHYKIIMHTLQNDATGLARTPSVNRVVLDYAETKRLEDDHFNLNHNRFDPQTETLLISYKTRAQNVSGVILRVYNLEGELIRQQDLPLPTGTLLPASGSWTWDGTNENGELVANGVYIIQYNSGDTHKIRKVVVLKQ